MYKTLENYSHKNCGHYPFITYQRDIAQQNRQLQALQHNAKRYENDVARGNIAPNRNSYSHSLQCTSKNQFCSKN